MAPCFVSSMPMAAARTSAFGASVCPSQPPGSLIAQRSNRVVASMSAKGSENEGIIEWLRKKIMHNALWEGDEEAGYELFFVEAMEAREKEKKRAYEEQEKQSKQ